MPTFERHISKEDEIRNELATATTLTEVVGILYNRVKGLQSSNNQTFTPDDLAKLILGATKSPSDWEKERTTITNKILALRDVLDDIIRSLKGPPCLVDYMLRQNLHTDGGTNAYPRPIERHPSAASFYRTAVDDRMASLIVAKIQTTPTPMTNKEYVDYLLGRMGRDDLIHNEQRDKKEGEQFYDFIQEHQAQLKGAVVLLQGQPWAVRGIGLGGGKEKGFSARITLQPEGDRSGKREIVVNRLREFSTLGIRFEDAALQANIDRLLSL